MDADDAEYGDFGDDPNADEKPGGALIEIWRSRVGSIVEEAIGATRL